MLLALELGIGIYLVIVICIFTFQRQLMYYPIKALTSPLGYGLETVREYFVPSRDGVMLQLWTHAAKPGYPTIIYFHGNSYNIGSRSAKFDGFIKAGYGLVSVNYRGFGRSEGRPHEQGIYSDAHTAIDYALNTLHLPQDKLIYFGESLGSGVTIEMAAERPPGLIVLEAAYTSVETRSAEMYPYVLGVRKLVRDKYDSLSKIARVKCPILMLHGERDITIPIRHGRALFDAANEPKRFIAYPKVHHADFTNDQLIKPMTEEAKKYGLISA